MLKRIVVSTSFNNLKWSDERLTREWIDKRLRLTMDYTVRSLINQTNQEFLSLIIYDRKSHKNIRSALEEYPELPENIRFVTAQDMNGHMEKYVEGADVLYNVRLDSDDMYHKTYVQQLHDYRHNGETRLLINQNGYFYDSVRNLIAEYYHFSPQFYVIVYDAEDFLYGERYKINGHADAINHPHELIVKRNYVNHVHSNNYSLGTFRLLCDRTLNNMGEIISEEEKVSAILQDFL